MKVTQRVNIQYTIDIDDLGEEVVRLMRVLQDKIESLEMNVPATTSALTLSTRDHIDNLRSALGEIDIGLRDVNAVINGYVAHQTQLHTEQPTGPSDALVPQVQENLHSLQEQLKNIRNLPTNEDPS